MSAISVAVIDSGVGGLTVANEIHLKLPNLRIHYVADHEGFPYGPLSADQIFQRLAKVTSAIITRYAPTIVVIACNSASTLVLDKLRSRFEVPFVGVVPAIKPAAALSKSGHIAVLATQATCDSPYLQQLIADFARGQSVYLVPSTDLVHEAEQQLCAKSNTRPVVPPTILQSVLQQPQTDTVVLACTHFPLLKPQLKQALPQIPYWIDSGEAIARRVEALLQAFRHDSNIVPPGNTFDLTGQAEWPYDEDAIGNMIGMFQRQRLDIT